MARERSVSTARSLGQRRHQSTGDIGVAVTLAEKGEHGLEPMTIIPLPRKTKPSHCFSHVGLFLSAADSKVDD